MATVDCERSKAGKFLIRLHILFLSCARYPSSLPFFADVYLLQKIWICELVSSSTNLANASYSTVYYLQVGGMWFWLMAQTSTNWQLISTKRLMIFGDNEQSGLDPNTYILSLCRYYLSFNCHWKLPLAKNWEKTTCLRKTCIKTQLKSVILRFIRPSNRQLWRQWRGFTHWDTPKWSTATQSALCRAVKIAH